MAVYPLTSIHRTPNSGLKYNLGETRESKVIVVASFYHVTLDFVHPLPSTFRGLGIQKLNGLAAKLLRFSNRIAIHR